MASLLGAVERGVRRTQDLVFIVSRASSEQGDAGADRDFRGPVQPIISTADPNDAAAIELLARDVLPQLRGIEAADPRGAPPIAR